MRTRSQPRAQAPVDAAPKPGGSVHQLPLWEIYEDLGQLADDPP